MKHGEYLEKYPNILEFHKDWYHTIAYKQDGKYIIEPRLRKYANVQHATIPDYEIDSEDIFISLYPPVSLKGEIWMAIEAKDNIDINSGLSNNREEALDFIYDNYVAEVEDFIDEMNQAGYRTEDAIKHHSNLPLNWRDRDLFNIKIYEGISVELYKKLSNMDKGTFYFQLIEVYLPV